MALGEGGQDDGGKEDGAHEAGGEELGQKIRDGWLGFDGAIAHT